MLLQQFQHYLKRNFSQLSIENCKLLLAVSGGIDSVVMTDLIYKSGFDFAIAHCNFQLRDEESIRDEVFVRTLTSNYKKEIFVQRFETSKYAASNKISIQEAARELRYDWFMKIVDGWQMTVDREENRQRSSANCQLLISTAHNADDNIETSLMFFLRGTGIHGLTGINHFDKTRKIIRPLLFATRKDISEYAKHNSLDWVEDSSNATTKYTRNFLRNNFIPSIEEHIASVKNNLAENINRFKEIELVYNEAIQSHKKKLLELKGNEIHIPILELKKIKALNTILWEIVKPYNFHSTQIDEIKKLFDADNSSYIQSSSHKIIKNRNWLIIAEHQTVTSDFILVEENDKEVNFKNGVLSFEILQAINYQLSAISSIAQLDAAEVHFPFVLRKWKQGDYFYPLGMLKKKKLSRFFIDLKLSSTQKEDVWVLEMNRKIIWVIGYRIDDRFKINNSTKQVFKITIANIN